MATSAEIYEGAASAYPDQHVVAHMSESLPLLQSTGSAKQDEPQERKRQPLPDGLAGEIRRRSAFAKRRPLASAKVPSNAYKLWAVPLAALTALLVFSALRRRCKSLEKRSRAPAARGAPFRRLARSDSYLAAVCGEEGEEGKDPDELLPQPFAANNPGEVWVPLLSLGPRSPPDRNGEDAVEIDVESNGPDDPSELPEAEPLYPRSAPLIALLDLMCVLAVVGLFIQTLMAFHLKDSKESPAAEILSSATTSGSPIILSSSTYRPTNGTPISERPSSSERISSIATPEQSPSSPVNASVATPEQSPSPPVDASLEETGNPSSGATPGGAPLDTFFSTITSSPPSGQNRSSPETNRSSGG